MLITSDLLRSVIVLGFLFIDKPSEVPLLFCLISAQVVIGSVFEPARSASLPNITSKDELLTANALSAATWSIMLALGAGFGGLATQAFGEQTVFLLDSGTYLVSAFFVARATIPQNTDPPEPGSLLRAATGKILEGWHYLRREPRVGRLTLAKAGWSLGGGGLVYLLALLGEEVAPHAAAAAMGILFAARGVGTGLGPILARRLLPNSATWPLAMGWCILISGVFYVSVFAFPWTFWIALPILAAHTTSGANWVMTSVLLQRRSEDRYRGRVFATEWLMIMVADSLSILAASLLLEGSVLRLDQAFVLFGSIQILCGVAWLLIVVPRERREALDSLSPSDER